MCRKRKVWRCGAAVMVLMMLTACARMSAQMTGNLWNQWRAVDALVQSDYPEAIPIILVHGWNGGEFTWPDAVALAGLEQRLGRDIYYFSYRTGIVAGSFPPVEILEEELERFLSSFKQVDIVAHSMGGLLVRQYLRHHPGYRIRRLVFLATPHFGTDAAKILAGVANVSLMGNPMGNLQADEMQPGSGFLWQLNMEKGAELRNVKALNIYVGDKNIVHSDLIVGAQSAYLPWAHNVAVVGGHHSLAMYFNKSKAVMNFLASGVFPDETPPPGRRDVWLRMIEPGGRAYMKLSESSVKRVNARGTPVRSGVSICCKLPAQMGPGVSRTVVIEDVRPGEKIVLTPRGGIPSITMDAGSLLSSDQPVMLREITLSGSRHKPAAGHGGGK